MNIIKNQMFNATLPLISLFTNFWISSNTTKIINDNFSQTETAIIQPLINNMHWYTTTNKFHAGNLAEHSAWTVKTISTWFKKNSSWCKGLDKKDKKILLFAALLHDVGKGGDLQSRYYTKIFHELIGQNYLLSKTPYYLNKNEIFDFDQMFKDLNISQEEREYISILVGAHSEFGKIMETTSPKELLSKNQSALINTLKSFLSTLLLLKYNANYKEKIDSKLLKLIIILNAADIKSSQPDKSEINNYKILQYPTKGKLLKKILISLFNKYFKNIF